MATIAVRTQEEERVIRAGDAILEIVRSDPQKEFDPADLVEQVAPAHDRYSARAALLYLLETGRIYLNAQWFVSYRNVSA